jgi:hypothetical protein
VLGTLPPRLRPGCTGELTFLEGVHDPADHGEGCLAFI